jgi:hypothetical protein
MDRTVESDDLTLQRRLLNTIPLVVKYVIYLLILSLWLY